MNKIIDLLPNIKGDEPDGFKRFTDFLFSEGIREIKIIDKPDKTKKDVSRRGKFDYLIRVDSDKRMALEFTQIFEKEEQRLRSIQWGNLVGAFRDEFKKYLSKHKKFNWRGIWNIETPEGFGANKNKAKIIASKNVINLIRAIERGKSSIEVDGFSLKLKRVVDTKIGDLYFSTSVKAGFIDPASDLEPKLKEKLPQKNEQLNIKDAERVLIIINKYIFGETRELVSALARIEEIWKCTNFDKIYFETSPGSFILVFSKELRNCWLSRKITKSPDLILPLQLWIYHLRSKNPRNTLSIIKKLLDKETPHKIIPDNFAREEIIHLSDWLIDQRRFKDVVWIIDKFIDDPDPQEPEKYSGDPKFNYHQQIVNGEDPHIITTVLGHLAWVIQKLAVRRKYIVKALGYTKKLLSHKNLYVKLQAIIPLIEIAGRRQWLKGWGKRPKEGKYKEFHKTVFDLVALVQKNPNYKAIAKWLCHIFAYYKDLSTREAEQVLDTLKITEESAGLFVYFGIFRQRHYKDQPIKFNGKKLEERLKEILKSSKKNYQRLKASIACHLCKILDENRNEFETIKPYIDLILEQPYQRDIYDDIERIISDWIKDKPDICIQWYKQMLSKISEFIEKSERAQLQGGLWLMYTEEIIEALARYNSDELLEAMKKLVSFWKKGTFIGSPKRLFESFKLIPNEEERVEVKREFQKWYNSMKKFNPKIEKVDWD